MTWSGGISIKAGWCLVLEYYSGLVSYTPRQIFLYGVFRPEVHLCPVLFLYFHSTTSFPFGHFRAIFMSIHGFDHGLATGASNIAGHLGNICAINISTFLRIVVSNGTMALVSIWSVLQPVVLRMTVHLFRMINVGALKLLCWALDKRDGGTSVYVNYLSVVILFVALTLFLCNV